MRVLLIEDEEKLAEAIKQGLEKNGYAVDYLTDGEKGFTRLSLYRNEYDLVILDLMLPGKSGEDICKEARAEKITLPILILTARGDVDEKVNLLQMGADDYVVKPFSFRELLARVQALLRRPTEAVPATLAVGDIELDTGTRAASRGGTELPLTLKEFALLEFFMRHPNQALNRETILDHLWGFDFASFSNVVDVHVKNLRKKLGNDGEEIIKTVRGIGYRMAG